MNSPASLAAHRNAATSPKVQLRLYVAGHTARSLMAFANLQRICETHLAGQYYIEVIDLTKTPQLAAGDQNSCRADPRAPPARADQEDHRRPLR